MRDLVRFAIGVLAFAILTAFISPCVFAQATVVTGEVCNILGTDYGDQGGDDLTSTKTHVVQTPSGMTRLTCVFNIPAGSVPAMLTILEGFICEVPVFVNGVFSHTVFIDDTRSVATPGGKVILTCTIPK